MKLFFILFFAFIQNNKFNTFTNISNTFEMKKNIFELKKNNNKYNGFDYRCNTNDTNNDRNNDRNNDTNHEEVNLYKIYKHFENKKLLDILKNKNISNNTKLLLLKDNTIKSSNLFAGNLMKDFDF